MRYGRSYASTWTKSDKIRQIEKDKRSDNNMFAHNNVLLVTYVTKSTHSPPVIKAGDVTLKAVDHFCYLDSILSTDVNADIDISARIAKASSSFGRLFKRLWNDHAIRRDTKVAVYKAAVLSVLLFGCESWTLYRHQSPYQKARPVSYEMPPTNSSHQVARQDPKYRSLADMSNYCHGRSVPANSATPMERICRKNGQRSGRLPRMIFYGQLQQGERSRGGQRKRYKDAPGSH